MTVARGNETKTINLCGISDSGNELLDYLQSLIDRSNGIIELQKVGDFYEAWILLDSEVEQQIHLNTYIVENKMAILDNHQNCLSGENLELAEHL